MFINVSTDRLNQGVVLIAQLQEIANHRRNRPMHKATRLNQTTDDRYIHTRSWRKLSTVQMERLD